jgi:hypothetical protein
MRAAGGKTAMVALMQFAFVLMLAALPALLATAWARRAVPLSARAGRNRALASPGRRG